MNSLEVGKAICSLLEGAQVFPLVADEDTEGAFLCYALSGLEVASSKDRYSYRERPTVELTIVAPTYSESVALAQQVRETIEPYRGNRMGLEIDGIRLLTARNSYSNDSYIHYLTYQITIV